MPTIPDWRHKLSVRARRIADSAADVLGYRYRYRLLLGIVVAQLLVLSMDVVHPWGTIAVPVLNLLLAVVLYSITRHQRDLWIVILLGTVGYVLDLLIPWSAAAPAVNLIKMAFWLAAPAFVGTRVFATVYMTERIRIDEIAGAVAVYVLLAHVFANVFQILLVLDPGAVQFGDNFPAQEIGFGEILYFSFVTLSTLGYGDISPITAPARATAVIESLSGVMYLAVMVAHFVSLRHVQAFRRSEKKRRER